MPYVIHTVGPQGEKPELLRSCYKRVLEVARENDVGSVAFCCISTGIYGYDNKKAANVALRTVRDWMDNNPTEVNKMTRIIFCTFLEKDRNIYETLLPAYFPRASNVDVISADES
ncbi:O-acetyl-ADP-ribose deacetylase macrod1 [Mortierella alpina]|nr:O-acetyl-ADP-ribose deacetylase macrod1 [Mortierella alpina]